MEFTIKKYLYSKMAFYRGKYRVYSDEELLNLYKTKNDSEIIGEIYRRYGHLVFGSCLNYLKDKESAEDVVMDIFASIGEKIQKYQIDYFKSWLYVLTRNECLSILRKKNLPTLPINNEIIYQDTSDNKDLIEIQLNELERAINQLKPPQDEVIRLFYLKEMSYKAISEQLKITLKAVKSAIQNGKRNLKIKLMENELFKSA